MATTELAQVETGTLAAGTVDVVGAYLKELDASEKTRATYGRALRQYVAWLDEQGVTLDRTTRAHVMAYKHHLEDTRSANTCASYLVAIRSLYTWLNARTGYPNVAEGVKSPKRKAQTGKDALTLSQARDLLNAPAEGEQELRDRAMVALMLRRGLRTVEVIRADVGDLRQVQRLSDWTPGQVGGYELLVDDLAGLDATAAAVLAELPYDLTLRTVVQEHPALFSWLDLLNANITLILTIMCIVSAIAIVSALLIMIFEKGATIGILKTLGASNASVRRIFLLKAVRLILWGIGIGLALALALSWVQRRWQPVRLDPESYSMSHVPVDMDWRVYALVAVGTLAVCLAALLLPASYISRISPAETVKGMRSEE